MKLEAQERLAIIMLLSATEGNFDAMHTLRRVRGMVGFSYDESERLKANQDIEAKEIHLDEWTKNHIATHLVSLSEKEKLPFEFLPIYEKFVFYDFSDKLDRPTPEEEAQMNARRKDKHTVALVGLSPRSCGYAPFQNSEVELWGENEAHAFKFFTRATRWFQVHNSYRQKTAKRGIQGHYDWLKANPWLIPIMMPKQDKSIPLSVDYPLAEVCEKYLGRLYRGGEHLKYFNSSFDYMIALALIDGFERIELYGFDMAGDNEYSLQKPSAEFWIGIASQHAEVALPENCLLVKSELYGGAEQGEAWQT